MVVFFYFNGINVGKNTVYRPPMDPMAKDPVPGVSPKKGSGPDPMCMC